METAHAAALRTDDAASRRAETVLAAEADFDFLSDEYRELFARSDATAFQHPLWLDAFHRRVAPARGARRAVVTGRDGSGRLLFLLPMIRRRMSGVALVESADLGVGDYASPVVRRSWQPASDIGGAVLALLQPLDILRVKPVRAETVASWLRFLPAEATELGFSAHAAAVSGDYAAWRRAAFSASFRSSLDRKRRKMAGEGALRLVRVVDPAELSEAVEAIRRRREGRFAGDPIQTPAVRDFYAEVAMRGAPAGMARVYRLELAGEAVGHVFGTIHHGRFNYLLIGCDYERFGRFSPGLVFYDLMMEDWLKEGGAVFDFTIGDEPFKASYGTAPTPMWQLTLKPTVRGRLAVLAAEARDRLRELSKPSESGAKG